MLILPKEIQEALIRHAQAEAPNEACGYLGGKDGTVSTCKTLTNVDHSPEHFSFDPKEQFDTIRSFRSEGVSAIAVYHSHPATPSRPSQEDIRLAYDPAISYVIISLAENSPVIKSFRIVKGVATEEPISDGSDK